MNPPGQLEVVVATVGRPHGVQGAVNLRLRSDRPEVRFVEGAVFQLAGSAAPSTPQLTLRSYRPTPAGAVAAFKEIQDRNGAEALRGADLVVWVDPAEEADAWYPAQLQGAAVVLPDGTPVGTVQGVLHFPAQDLLEITQVDGTSALVPLVEELVPEVDLEQGRVVIDPPVGLVAARSNPETHPHRPPTFED